jgi:hypothetical protein
MQTLQAAQIDPLKRTVEKSTENSRPLSVAPAAAQKTQAKVIRQPQPAEPRSQPANQIQARMR